MASASASSVPSPHSTSGTGRSIGATVGSGTSMPRRCARTRSGTLRARPGKGRSRSSTTTSPQPTSGPYERRVTTRDGGEWHPANGECDGDGRPPPGDVVVEVAEDLLEAGVEVAGDRDEQQVELERRQPAGGGQVLEPARRPGCEDECRALREPVDEPDQRLGLTVEHAVDGLVRQVEAAERIVRGRVG